MNKSKVSVDEAIEIAGVSRSTFYGKYISKGVISKSKIGSRVYIDLSELYRVFPDAVQKNTDKSPNIDKIEQENTLLRQELLFQNKQLEHYKQLEQQAILREQKLHQTIEHYQRALEAPKPKSTKDELIRKLKVFKKNGESLQQTLDRINTYSRPGETQGKTINRLYQEMIKEK